MKSILVLVGSISPVSSNKRLVEFLIRQLSDRFTFRIYEGLATLPHFDPEASLYNLPDSINRLRTAIEAADRVLICTPEYVFSIPSVLKNAIEWCVASTVFTDKPVALITASAHGQRGHEQLQLIMKTVGAKLDERTNLLIQGIRGKINEEGVITDSATMDVILQFVAHLSAAATPAGN